MGLESESSVSHSPHREAKLTPSSRQQERLVLLGLLGLAAAQGLWNAFHVPPLTGYDAGGHAAYMLTILREGRLPHPTDGWSTFHPPLYHALGAATWAFLDGAAGRIVTGALRTWNVLAWLALGAAAYASVRRLGARYETAAVAAAVALFAPCSQMAASMISNEMLAAGLASLALLAVLGVRDDSRRSVLGGGLAGLALAAKATGIWVAVAVMTLVSASRALSVDPVGAITAPDGPSDPPCPAPESGSRASCRRRRLQVLLLTGLAITMVAAPLYARNMALTGSPLPNVLSREVGPQKHAEESFTLRPRRITDYLWLNPLCILHPSVYVIPGPSGRPWDVNRNMTSVWGLAYASTWWDAYGHRISPRLYGNSAYAPLLGLLGLVPTAMVLFGLGLTLVRVSRGLRRREGLPPETPLLVMTLFALSTYVAFTYQNSSLVTAKGAYLLPLAVPAAVFFARGVEWLGEERQRLVLGLSLAAAGLAAVLFTDGLVFESIRAEPTRNAWLLFAEQLPGTHMDEAVELLMDRY